MAVSRKVAGFGLAAVSLALTVTGVVIAATDSSPAGNSDPLALHGYPPRSAQLHVVISTGQAYEVTADLNINFRTDALSARVYAPLLFSAVEVDARLVHRHVYLTSPNLSTIIGTRWLSMNAGQPSLYGLSLEMTHPELGLISGFTQKTVTRSGPFTTYDYRRANVSITAPQGLPVTVGQSGEITATRLVVTSKHSTASVTVTVTSYNGPARIVAPPARQVTPVDTSRLGQIFGSPSLGNLLSPQGIASLGQVSLS